MRRFEVMEIGRDPLPAIDLEEDVVVIGSGSSARIRLPAATAAPFALRLEGGRWRAGSDVVVDGVRHRAGDSGELGWGHAVTFEVGAYRVRVGDAPRDAAASSPQRTESLARELVRSLLGAGAAPAFEIVDGANPARRELPPPEAVLVIGRGDEADWVILDEDLSREHAEVRRGWEGVTIRDLGSKNGTTVAGRRLAEGEAAELHDGAAVVVADVRIVFRDPAERHLRGEDAADARAMPAMSTDVAIAAAGAPAATSRAPLWIAAAIAAVALAGLAWVLA